MASTFVPIMPLPSSGANGNSLPTFVQNFGTTLPIPLGKGWNGGNGVMQVMDPIQPLPGVIGVASTAI